MELDFVCSICQLRVATKACLCEFPPTFLCESDLEKHREEGAHFLLSSKEGTKVGSEEEWSSCKQRLAKLRMAHSVVESFDFLVGDLNKAHTTLLHALKLQAAQVRRRLQEFQGAFQEQAAAALKEARNHVLEKWRPPEDSLAALFWDFDAEHFRSLFDLRASTAAVQQCPFSLRISLPSLSRFSLQPADSVGEAGRDAEWRRQLEQLYEENAALSQEVARLRALAADSIKESQGDVLPRIAGDSLFISNLRTRRVVQEKKLPEALLCTMFCPLDKNSVLCVGSFPASTRARLLTVRQGVLQELPAMKSARFYPGIIKLDGAVYVFGGCNGVVALAESEQFLAGVWSDLPDMLYGRFGFSPCEFGRVVYLLDVRSSLKVVEQFSLSTRCFTALSVKVPSELTSHSSVAFTVNDELIVLTAEGHLGSWRPGQSSFLLSRSCSLLLSPARFRSASGQDSGSESGGQGDWNSHEPE